MVTSRGSPKTVIASVKATRCRLRFRSAFSGSHSNSIPRAYLKGHIRPLTITLSCEAFLYGLYRGTDLTRRDSGYGNVLPDVITIYQGPIAEDSDSVADMEALVQDTVVHEIGHYFGLDDDRLEELEEE